MSRGSKSGSAPAGCAPLVHTGEFGAVPIPGSTDKSREGAGAGVLLMQQLWLDVQAEADENRQASLIANTLHPAFMEHCTQFDTLAYKRAFGDGSTLTSVVCRTLCREARRALRDGNPAQKISCAALLSSNGHLALLAILSSVCDNNFYRGAIDRAVLDNVIRVVVLHNVPSMLVALHEVFLGIVVENAGNVMRHELGGLSRELIAAAQKQATLLQELVDHASVANDLHAAASGEALADTFGTLVAYPFVGSSSISALVADVCTSLLQGPHKRIIFPNSSAAAQFRSCIICAFDKCTDSSKTLTDESIILQRLNTIVHTLAVSRALFRAFPPLLGGSQTDFFGPTQFQNLCELLLAMQEALGHQRRASQRVFESIAWLATVQPAQSCSAAAAAVGDGAAAASIPENTKRRGISLFHAVASVFQRESTASPRAKEGSSSVSQYAAPADRHQFANQTALMTLAEFVGRCANEDARVQAVQQLICVMKTHGGDAEFTIVFEYLVAQIAEFPGTVMIQLIDAIEVFAGSATGHPGDGSAATGFVSQSRVLEVTSALVANLSQRCPSAAVANRTVALLISLAANKSISPKLPENGSVSLCISLAQWLFQGLLPDDDGLGPRITALWKMILRLPGCMEVCIAESAAERIIGIIGCRSQHPEGTAPTVPPPHHNPVVHARSMLIALVQQSHPQIAHLADRILVESDHDRTSATVVDLLVTLAAVIHTTKCEKEAIRQNIIEICLSLLQSIHQSSCMAVGVHAITTCISLLVPVVRFSELGRMLHASVPKRLRGDKLMCQMMIDLTNGWCSHGDSISAMLYYFDSGGDLNSGEIPFKGEGAQKIGGFFFPAQRNMFGVEFTSPVMVLAKWAEDLERGKITPPSPPHPEDVRRAITHLCADMATKPSDDDFARFVARHALHTVHLADISPITDEFLCDRSRGLKWWGSALQRPLSDLCFSQFIEFREGSGASGEVDVASRVWPPSNGYSIAMWIRWANTPSMTSDGVARAGVPRDSFDSYVDGGDAIDDEEKFMVQLFSLAWPSTPDANSPQTRVAMFVDTVHRVSLFTLELGGHKSSVPFPFIHPDEWVHVAVVHHKNKLFASEVRCYINAVLQMKQALTYPIPNTVSGVASQLAMVGTAKSFKCTIGFELARAMKNVRLRFGSFQVYDTAISPEVITAITASPLSSRVVAESTHSSGIQCGCITTSDVNRLSLLSAGAAPVSTHAAGEQEQHLIVALHPSAASLIDANFRSLDNKDWSLQNTACLYGSSFVLQGIFSEPTPTQTSPVQVLISIGGFACLKRWLVELCNEMRLTDCTEDAENEARLSSTIATVLQIFGHCALHSDYAQLRDRAVQHEIASIVAPLASRLLGHADFRSALLSCVCVTIEAGCVMGATLSVSHTPRRYPMIWNAIVADALLFNFDLLMKFSSRAVMPWALHQLCSLISGDNPFAPFNAATLVKYSAHTALIYGAVRHPVDNAILLEIGKLLGLLLTACTFDATVVSDLLTFCLATVPLDGDEQGVELRLGSRLVGCATYVSSICNCVLRALLLCSDSPLFVTSCTMVLPHFWLPVMTDRYASPVTASLAMCLGISLATQCTSVRRSLERFASIRALHATLSHHSHQNDILTLLMEASTGSAPGTHLLHGTSCGGAGALKHGDPLRGPLMSLFLHLLKCCSISAQEGGTSQSFPRQPPTTVLEYFMRLGKCCSSRVCGGHQRAVRRWRVGCIAVRSTLRLRHFAAQKNLCKTRHEGRAEGFLPLHRTMLDMPSASERRRRVELVCSMLRSLRMSVSEDHPTHSTLVNSPGSLSSLAWILLCCMPRDLEGITDASPTRREFGLIEYDEDSDEDTTRVSYTRPLYRAHGWLLDSMAMPPQGCQVYDEVAGLYRAIFENCLRVHTLVSVNAHNIRTTQFTTLVHEILTTVPQGVGDASSDWFTSQVIGIATRVCLHALRRVPLTTDEGRATAKNAFSLSQYLMDRFVSGHPAPCRMVGDFAVELLPIFHKLFTGECRHLMSMIFDWAVHVISPGHHGWAIKRMEAAREAIHHHRDLVLGHQFPTQECLRCFFVKLVELSLGLLLDYDATLSPSGISLGEMWQKLFVANHSSPVFTQLLAGPQDLLHGGFDTLYMKVGAQEMFLSWFVDNKFMIKDAFQRNTKVKLRHKNIACHPRRHDRWFTRSREEQLQDVVRIETKTEEAITAAGSAWNRHCVTATTIEAPFLRYNSSTANAVSNGSSAAQLVHDVKVLQQDECVHLAHIGGTTVRRLRSSGLSADAGSPTSPTPGRGQEGWQAKRDHQEQLRHTLQMQLSPVVPVSIAAYVHQYGGSVIPVSAAEAKHPAQVALPELQPNAAQLLLRIIDDGRSEQGAPLLKWIGNIYLVLGLETIICTMIMTHTECIIVSSSQVTEAGDFFIAQQRPHDAASQSHVQSGIAAALWRFLPRSPAQAILSSASEAAFRHSQYYRQLRADALVGNSRSYVWRFPWSRVAAVHQRRFQHRSAALEFMLDDGIAVLVVVLDKYMTMSKAERQRVVATLEEEPVSFAVSSSSGKKVVLAGAQKKWLRRQMSTYEYLTIINDVASRTSADMTQYPVFPWVLKEFVSAEIDLADALVYRDLAKPVGATDPRRAAELITRFNDCVDMGETPFHHGTHYSMGAVVLYFMVRLSPFTTMAINFQGGRLDVADRLFHSIAEAWASSSGAGSDVKELIPELFSSSIYLRNENNVPLGVRVGDGVSLGNVVLPGWCNGSPERFIVLHRAALESEHVSSMLHKWIDLIFGFKQQGEDAVKSVNVFHHLSYDEGLDKAIADAKSEEERKAIVASLDNFGLTPKQVFRTPHPKRGSAVTTPRQQVFLAACTQMVPRGITANHAAPAQQPMPVASLMEVEAVMYCSTKTHSFAAAAAPQPQYFALREHHGCIAAYAARDHNLVTSISSLHPHGQGKPTSIAAAPSGKLLLCGTKKGRVMIFSRSSSQHQFALSSIIHGTMDNPVHVLKFFNDSLFAVSWDNSADIAVWRSSTSCIDICFHTAIHGAASKRVGEVGRGSRICGGTERDCIVDAAHARSENAVVAISKRTIVLLSMSGAVLSYLDLEGIVISSPSRGRCSNSGYQGNTWDGSPNRAESQQIGALSTLQEPLACVGWFNFQGYCASNVMVCGHDDGWVSFWSVSVDFASCAAYVYEIQFVGAATTGKKAAATALLPQPETFSVVVGHHDGTVTCLTVPHQVGSDMSISLDSV